MTAVTNDAAVASAPKMASTARDGWIFLSLSFGGATIAVLLFWLASRQQDFAAADAYGTFGVVLAVAALVTLVYAAVQFVKGLRRGLRSRWQIAGSVLSISLATLALAVFLVGQRYIREPVVAAAAIALPMAVFLAFVLMLPLHAWRGARPGVMLGSACIFTLLFLLAAGILEYELQRNTRYSSTKKGQFLFWLEFIPVQIRRPAGGAFSRISPSFHYFAYHATWYPPDELKRAALRPALTPEAYAAWHGWERRNAEEALQAALSLPPDKLPSVNTNATREFCAGRMIGRRAPPALIRARTNSAYSDSMIAGIFSALYDRKEVGRTFHAEAAQCIELARTVDGYDWVVLTLNPPERDAFILKHLRAGDAKGLLNRLEVWHIADCGPELRRELLLSALPRWRRLGIEVLRAAEQPLHLTKEEWRRVLAISSGDLPAAPDERIYAAQELMRGLGLTLREPDFAVKYWLNSTQNLNPLLREVLEAAGVRIEALKE